ncbi:MAG TPA: ADOP family duplicated permease [Candidatus Limnocylindrales bacterium]|nr:ADOP family duplicated permease [Candidatus Limnocylindrales bacterium]
MRFLDAFTRDLRFALRQIAKNPLFALIIIVSLGVAIGANTAIFTLLDAISLRQLDVPRAAQLVEINEVTAENSPRAVSYAQLNELRSRQSVFSSVSGWLLPMSNVEVRGVPSLAAVQYVSGDFYSTYPVRAILGRTLLPSDFHPSSGASSNVAVISFECWRDRFGADPHVVGQLIRVEGRPYSIVGVTSQGFSSPQIDVSADATIPVEAAPFELFGSNLESMPLLVTARLRDKVSFQEADAQLQVLWPSILRDTEPASLSSKDVAEDLARRVQLVPGSRGQSFLRRDFSQSAAILMAAVAALLLLACLNVATLLLARASARSGEIAVRLALGAKRSRILRQLLTESLVLAASSALVGLVLAQWSSPLLLSLMWNSPVKLTISLRPDLLVLAFTIAAVFLATILFGLAPGWLTIRESAPLYAAARTIVGGRGGWLRRGLVAAQVALAVVLLVGAGLLIRTAHHLATADLGFDPQHVAVFSLTPDPGGYGSLDIASYKRDLLARVSAIPGVASASLSDSSPVQVNRWSEPVFLPSSDRSASAPKANLYFISPGFFQTLGASVVRGRDFAPSDTTTSQRVAIVSQSLADRLVPAGDAVGRAISIGDHDPRQNLQIVGIARDARFGDLHQHDPLIAYLPLFQVAGAEDSRILEWGYLEVRSQAGPLAIMPAVDAQIRSLGREFVRSTATMSRAIAINLSEDRMLASLSTFFGVVAGFLALIGLYGLLSYAVNRRTREFGVRLALGAQTNAVFFSVVKEALALVLAGMAIGIPCAIAVAKILASRLPNLAADDVLPFVAAILLLALAGAFAAFAPARRASRVNPIDALRSE